MDTSVVGRLVEAIAGASQLLDSERERWVTNSHSYRGGRNITHPAPSQSEIFTDLPWVYSPMAPSPSSRPQPDCL